MQQLKLEKVEWSGTSAHYTQPSNNQRLSASPQPEPGKQWKVQRNPAPHVSALVSSSGYFDTKSAGIPAIICDAQMFLCGTGNDFIAAKAHGAQVRALPKQFRNPTRHHWEALEKILTCKYVTLRWMIWRCQWHQTWRGLPNSSWLVYILSMPPTRSKFCELPVAIQRRLINKARDFLERCFSVVSHLNRGNGCLGWKQLDTLAWACYWSSLGVT